MAPVRGAQRCNRILLPALLVLATLVAAPFAASAPAVKAASESRPRSTVSGWQQQTVSADACSTANMERLSDALVTGAGMSRADAESFVFVIEYLTTSCACLDDLQGLLSPATLSAPQQALSQIGSDCGSALDTVTSLLGQYIAPPASPTPTPSS